MYNFKLGNMYLYDPTEVLEKQIEDCSEHFYLKYDVYPDTVFVNPKYAGDNERNYKTKKGKSMRIVPEEKEGPKQFTLAVKKGLTK